MSSLLNRLAGATRDAAIARGSSVTPEGVIRPSELVLPDDFITSLVETVDKTPEKSRSGGSKGYIHLSSLLDACAREHVLAKRFGSPSAQVVTGGHKVVWRMGRAAEAHIRDAVITARNKRGVYGKWVCRCGYSEHIGEHPSRQSCQRCSHGLNTYKEPWLLDRVHEIGGSPDLSLLLGRSMLVIEIKSMNKEDFDKLTAPLPDHIIQACGYRRIYRDMGFAVFDTVRIFYVRKEFLWGGRGKIYKEFTVDASAWDRQVDRLFSEGLSIAEHSRAGTLPDRLSLCHSLGAARAKKCSMCVGCFQV
jgi:hypothetical protein